jgi:hypothetical protein
MSKWHITYYVKGDTGYPKGASTRQVENGWIEVKYVVESEVKPKIEILEGPVYMLANIQKEKSPTPYISTQGAKKVKPEARFASRHY